jgi:hypothetical protein
MAEEFMRSFSGINQSRGTCKFQVGDSKFVSRAGSYDLCPKLGYQQLFLAVMRDFPTLTKLSPYKNRGKNIAERRGFVSERVYKLAEIASCLGFANDQISQIQSMGAESSYAAATSEYLVQLQPTDRYIVDSRRRADIAQYVGDTLPHISVNRPSHERAEVNTNLSEAPKKSRCSRPSIQDYHKYREYLFLGILMDNSFVRRAHPNSLAIQKDIFFSFFGDLNGSQEDLSESSFQENDSSPRHSFAHPPPNQSPYESPSPRYSPSPTSPLQESPTQQGESPIPQENIISPQEVREAIPDEQSWVSGSITTASNEYSGSNFLDPDYEFSDEREVPFESIEQDIRPSSFIHGLVYDEGNVVFYLLSEKRFVRFSFDEPELPNFRATTNWLANQNNMFLCCISNRWCVVPIRKLYTSSRKAKLILVCQKLCRTGAEPGTILHLRNGLNRFLDRDYDYATHNHGR